MTIRIELTREEEAEIRSRATARRTAPEELVAEFIRAHLLHAAGDSESEVLPVVDEQGNFHPERLEAVLARCAELSAGLPYLPPESLRREALYQDHD